MHNILSTIRMELALVDSVDVVYFLKMSTMPTDHARSTVPIIEYNGLDSNVERWELSGYTWRRNIYQKRSASRLSLFIDSDCAREIMFAGFTSVHAILLRDGSVKSIPPNHRFVDASRTKPEQIDPSENIQRARN